jgi:hypothetical protein
MDVAALASGSAFGRRAGYGQLRRDQVRISQSSMVGYWNVGGGWGADLLVEHVPIAKLRAVAWRR